jgi:hypothetical protein
VEIPFLSTLVYWEGLILIGGLTAVVLWKLMTGEIALDKLFDGDIRNSRGGYDSYSSLGRVQAFWVTIYTAFYYVTQVVHNPTEFPTIPTWLVATLAGSHGLYLGGKAQAMLLGRMKDILK